MRAAAILVLFVVAASSARAAPASADAADRLLALDWSQRLVHDVAQLHAVTLRNAGADAATVARFGSAAALATLRRLTGDAVAARLERSISRTDQDAIATVAAWATSDVGKVIAAAEAAPATDIGHAPAGDASERARLCVAIIDHDAAIAANQLAAASAVRLTRDLLHEDASPPAPQDARNAASLAYSRVYAPVALAALQPYAAHLRTVPAVLARAILLDALVEALPGWLAAAAGTHAGAAAGSGTTAIPPG